MVVPVSHWVQELLELLEFIWDDCHSCKLRAQAVARTFQQTWAFSAGSENPEVSSMSLSHTDSKRIWCMLSSSKTQRNFKKNGRPPPLSNSLSTLPLWREWGGENQLGTDSRMLKTTPASIIMQAETKSLFIICIKIHLGLWLDCVPRLLESVSI